MQEMNIAELDLNLLVALDALLREESVTQAARRLGKSQPALSHTLGRLRDVFDDQLLVPGKGGMKPTPKADSLRAPLERVLRQIESLISVETQFEPASTTRSFTIGCPDLFGIVLESVVTWFAGQAPRAHFEMSSSNLDELEGALEAGRHEIVLGPVPDQATSQLRQRYVGKLEWCCLVRPDHPVLTGEFTLDNWVAFGHVMVAYGHRARSMVGAAIQSAGSSRRVAVTVPSFLAAASAVANTDYILTAPHMLAAHAGRQHGLVPVRPPIELPITHVGVMWHERWDADAGHEWFRTGVWRQIKDRWDDKPVFDD